MAKQDKLNRIPPFLPFLWQDWRSSQTVRRMTHSQRSIYLDILIEQWISGNVPRDAWRLAGMIQADYKSTVRLLENFSEVLVCCQCGASWTPVNCQCGASNLTATCHNPKLRNIRIDVDSGVALGTTEPNLTQPHLTEPQLASASQTGGGGISNSVVERYFDQGNKRDGAMAEEPTPTPDPLVDDFIALLAPPKPPCPQTYNHWSGVFGRLVGVHGEAKFKTIMAYCFQHERYCRGIRTVKKQDKADWFYDNFVELAERMVADQEFDARRSQKAAKNKTPENAPDYIKNPSGNVSFGKSVV
jgi:hypothetical protein